MDYKQRKEALAVLAGILGGEGWEPFVAKAYQENQWFTPENVFKSLTNLGKMLSQEALNLWLKDLKIPEHPISKKIGIIMAGNIPLVGLHDLICCFITGNHALIKMSSDDKVLLPELIRRWVEVIPEIKNYITIVEKLSDYEAVIATGSNNTTRHFEYYFKDVPRLIRRNRHSVAIIRGDETESDYIKLGDDLFSYFGLGCRNVSKLYIPRTFDFIPFYDAIQIYNEIRNHNKYANNHTYHKAINLMNLVKIYDNDFLILNEHAQVSSPVAVCHYEYYDNENHLHELIERDAENIQCIVKSDRNPFEIRSKELRHRMFYFGEAQQPGLSDYADGVDTLHWLLNMK